MADFIKNAELQHKCGFLLSRGGSAGINAQMQARPTWRGSLGVYSVTSGISSKTCGSDS